MKFDVDGIQQDYIDNQLEELMNIDNRISQSIDKLKALQQESQFFKTKLDFELTKKKKILQKIIESNKSV